MRKITSDKPIVIIYNPNSGKLIDLRPIIEQRLNAAGIKFELMPTQKYFDAFEFARDMKLSDYSMLVAVGGDGTVHEVTNGMLAREDGLRIPLAGIPNGSGNDMMNGIGVKNVDIALDYICKKTVAKMDIMRCLVDVKSEKDIPAGKRWAHCRYFNNSVSFGMPAKIAIGAKPYKACCGTGSYKIAAIKLGCMCQTDPGSYDV